MSLDIAELGRLISAKRDREMLGVRAAAKEIGTSPATLSRIENGHIPDLGTFAAICQWLAIDPAQFLGMTPAEGQDAPVMVHLRKKDTTTLDTAIALGDLIIAAQQAVRDRSYV